MAKNKMNTGVGLLAGYLTGDELAAQLGVTVRTVWRWQNSKNGLPSTKIGGKVLFRTESVMKWIEGHERQLNRS